MYILVLLFQANVTLEMFYAITSWRVQTVLKITQPVVYTIIMGPKRDQCAISVGSLDQRVMLPKRD